MTEPITITSAQAVEPVGPNADIWPVTTQLEVSVSTPSDESPTDEFWVQQGRFATRSVVLDSEDKALAVAAALVAAVEKARQWRREQGRAA